MNDTTQAQQFTGGLQAGVTTGSAKIREVPGAFTEVIRGDNVFGVEGGVYGRLDLEPFYVRPSLLLAYRHGFLAQEKPEGVSVETEFTANKLEVPVLLGLQLVGPLSIEGGPVYNYLINATERYDGRDVLLTKSGLGYRVGACVAFGRANVSVHYQGASHKASDDKASFSVPHELVFGVGLQLGGGER